MSDQFAQIDQAAKEAQAEFEVIKADPNHTFEQFEAWFKKWYAQATYKQLGLIVVHEQSKVHRG
jgi:hypothetical protein